MPRVRRAAWLSFLALDVRLAGVVRAAREPMLGQMKLAWWRDRLNADPATWPKGEPLLAMLKGWGGEAKGLVPLVDGWEVLLDEWDGGAALEALTQGRVAGVEALARVLGVANDRIAPMTRCWAAMDLASHLGDPAEREAAMAKVAALDWKAGRLPKAMRPLTVLHGLARRESKGGDAASPMALLSAMRLGIFGMGVFVVASLMRKTGSHFFARCSSLPPLVEEGLG
jgi:phytoene synthase